MNKNRVCRTCEAYRFGGECAEGVPDGECGKWRPRKHFNCIGAAAAYVHEIGHKEGYRVDREGDVYRLTLGLELDDDE